MHSSDTILSDNILTIPETGAIRLKYIPLLIIGGFILLLALAVAASAISNIGLPTTYEAEATLSDVTKARLAEYLHLLEEMGDEVWPGSGEQPSWSAVHIPAIVHNGAYAFLVGYPGEPPDGWVVVPSGDQLGRAWTRVPDDTFQGEPYYRQPLVASERTPENFTVRVGDRWVATLYMKEYMRVEFFRGFREELPPFLRPVFPYRLAWTVLMGPTENYLAGLAHEAFHAYQGTVAPERLAEAEGVHGIEGRYDFGAAEEAWQVELDALYDAAKAAADPRTPEDEVVALTQTFLDARASRREAQGLGDDTIAYEQKREWLEGLAKYAELTIGVSAQDAVEAGTYGPVPVLEVDGGFKGYRTRERFWRAQLGEVKRMLSHDGEIRFYYTGFAQGVILDRLMPDWKARAMADGVWIEMLVAEAVR